MLEGEYWQEEVQHAELEGSQTAPEVNLQVEESQHDEVVFPPGSQSSPSSTIPLPHCCKLITLLSPGVCIQLVDTALFPILLHIFPSVHPENVCSVVDVVGFMINWPFALHVDVVKGQQEPEREQPDVQS